MRQSVSANASTSAQSPSLPFLLKSRNECCKHHRERDTAPVPTDIADKLIIIEVRVCSIEVAFT